jgi:hypothetical protein
MLWLPLSLVLLFVSPAALAADFHIEPKRPLSPAQELRVADGDRFIKVSGETFTYIFRKDNGLIGAVEVLGRDITGGTPIPDLSVAEHLDPDFSPYSARYERNARVRLVTAGPAQVVIEAEGGYAAQDGKRFPLRLDLRYDVSIDGVILVALSNSATEPCDFRWLVLSAGAVRREVAKFINWMPEQATSQTTDYRFRSLQQKQGNPILSGTWIPWIWIGDQVAGLEVTTWDVRSQTYNRVDSSSREDEPSMFVVNQKDAQVRWENYLVRRTRIHAEKGWTRAGSFALAVTPSKKFDPYFSTIKGAHLGPHQHVKDLTLPGEPEIRTLAQNGYDLIVGMANWRSGEYVPLNEAALQRTIALCHKYGVRIIPYVTLVDLAHSTAAFRLHGEDWAIEPTTEFIHHLRPDDLKAELAFRNTDEEETTLMCPGAEGWRAHWKQQVDRVIQNYDFDGIYFDFWYGRMTCENSRHGCGGRFRRGTVLGSREMLMYAWNRLKAKNPRSIIKANTNTLASALITSLVDIRLVGEAIDAAGMDETSRHWLHSSYRLGETTEFLWDQTPWSFARKALFAALVNFLPQRYERPTFEPRKSFDDFDVFRSFDDGSGNWQLGISSSAEMAKPAARFNVIEKRGAKLVTLINASDSDMVAEIPLAKGWIACEPLTDQLQVPGGNVVEAKLNGGAYRHFLCLQTPASPQLLYALGARAPARQEYDAGSRALRVTLDAVEGAKLRLAIYTPAPVKSVVGNGGVQIPFNWTPGSSLLTFDAVHVPGQAYAVRFE